MSAPESPARPQEQPSPKKLSRVQAAISAFNAKEKDVDVHKHLDSKDLESEFEKLLVGTPRSRRLTVHLLTPSLGCEKYSP
jgi:hypothetical protein